MNLDGDPRSAWRFSIAISANRCLARRLIPVGFGRLADVGSGGGFPGLPLKIVCPELEVCLIDSNVKKATFLAEVVRELALPEARVLVSRYEELDEEITPLDVVCSRAVGEFGHFLKWAASEKIGARTVMLWIGGRDLDEARASKDWYWNEPVAIPQSLRRFILVGRRTEEVTR